MQRILKRWGATRAVYENYDGAGCWGEDEELNEGDQLFYIGLPGEAESIWAGTMSQWLVEATYKNSEACKDASALQVAWGLQC